MATLFIHMAFAFYLIFDALVSKSTMDIHASELAKIVVIFAEAVVRHHELKKARKLDPPKS